MVEKICYHLVVGRKERGISVLINGMKILKNRICIDKEIEVV